MRFITGEWAGTTVVDGPGHVRLADTPQADIHRADTLPIPGVALLVEAPQATAVEAPTADPDLSPEADLDPHCLPLAGGALQAQLVPLPGLLPLPVPAHVCQHFAHPVAACHAALHFLAPPHSSTFHSRKSVAPFKLKVLQGTSRQTSRRCIQGRV